MEFFYYYFIAVNILGFFLMALDKRKAKKHLWRTPEIYFFSISFIGGALGTWLGMYSFRHKTKHLSFIMGIPFLLALNIAIIYLGARYIK